MSNLYVRMALYILSPVLAAIATASAGIVTYDAASSVLTVQVDGLVTVIVGAVTGGGAISLGILKRWGVR